MDSTEKGFHIVMAGEKAILEKGFHILEDKSLLTFNTDDPDAFRSFLCTVGKEIIIVYDEKSIKASHSKPDYSCPGYVAICNMKESPIVSMLRSAYSSSGVPAAEFEKFLYTMRNYYDVNGRKLYDQVKHLTIKKVTKIEKKSDTQGNFQYHVTRTGDQEDMEATPQITFNVPVLQNIKKEMEITFDVHLKYKDIEGGVEIAYELVNPFFEEDLRRDKRALVKEQLATYSCPVLLGDVTLKQATDAWKYKENGID